MTAYHSQNLPYVPGLDLGISALVHILRNHGVETFESCEGGGGHAFPEPTIRFSGQPGDGAHAYAITRTFALPVSQIRRVWDEIEGELTGPCWEIVFRRKWQGEAVLTGDSDNTPFLEVLKRLDCYDGRSPRKKGATD